LFQYSKYTYFGGRCGADTAGAVFRDTQLSVGASTFTIDSLLPIDSRFLLVADVEKANAFIGYFSSVSTTDDGLVALRDRVCLPDSPDRITISELNVMSLKM